MLQTLQLRFIKKTMNKSRLILEDKVYVKFDDEGNTSIVDHDHLEPGFCYRRVKDTHEGDRKSLFNMPEAFIDREFIIDQEKLVGLGDRNQRVVLIRLYDIYKMCKKTQNLQFFPSRYSTTQKKLSSDPFLPTFATQIGLFPAEYYKSFFITQDFNPCGKYIMVINHNGRFETDVVDDWIPVYENTLQPIWGFDIDQSWKIILLKFWAKRCKGYENVRNVAPFNFIQCFSNSNWKYFNLTKDGLRFLSYYTGKIGLGKFVLKTKNSQIVKEAGLIPDSAGYELIGLVETTGNHSSPNPESPDLHRKWIITVRSTMINKWSGNLSVLDKQMNTLYQPQKQKLSLQRDLMMSQSDFINLFSTAYIASRRDQQQRHYISDYYLLTIEPEIKKSIYLRFQAEKDGWFDFCVRQADDVRVPPTQQSRLRGVDKSENGYNDGLRFLKCKYILVKENDANSPSIYGEPDYVAPHYDTYEIEYYHGYNRSDAKFLNLVKGNYILKIKPQAYSKISKFVLNYASNLSIKFQQYFPDKKQSSLILREAMASLIGPMAKTSSQSGIKDTDRKFEEVVFANYFDNIGYGFVGVRLNRACPYSVLIQVDPQEVKNSGYRLKNQFKNLTQPFSIFVKPGESSAVVLKKIVGGKHLWPPKGFAIFKNNQK